MRFSLTGTMNLGWPAVRDAVQLAEQLGFDEFTTSDHLMAVAGFDTEKGILDAVGLLLALAPLTRTIRLGCLVSPVTFRDPVILLRQLQTLDVVSEGRAIAGIGAGWSSEEHDAFGYPFPSVRERLDRLEAACEQTRTLWPRLRPRAPQEQVHLLVAGASPRVLRMAARWADAWHAFGTPAFMAAKVAELATLTVPGGPVERQAARPLEITVNLIAVLSDDRAFVDETRRRMAASAATTVRTGDRAQAAMAAPGEEGGSPMFVGGASELRELVERYAAAGVDRVVLTMPRPLNPATLEALADAVGLR